MKRSYSSEMMDDYSFKDERVDKALEELKIINKYLGGVSVTKKGLKKILGKYFLKYPVSVIDIGGGASDILFSLNNEMKIFSLDINHRISLFAKKKSKKINVICADVFNLPLKQKIFDIAHLSLFLHHFNETEIKTILNSIAAITKYSIIINDLQRSVFALAGIKILTSLFSKSEFVKNDAPLSVKKGFTKEELTSILDDLKFNYEINYNWAFRWMVVIYLK